MKNLFIILFFIPTLFFAQDNIKGMVMEPSPQGKHLPLARVVGGVDEKSTSLSNILIVNSRKNNRSIFQDMEMISFGPNIKGAHSPDERVQISSVQKFWIFVLEILKHIPKA